MKLQNSELLRSQGLINNQWVAAQSGKTFQVFNPFNGEVIATLPEMNEVDTKAAIAAADAAKKTWAEQDGTERKRILDRWAQLIEQNIQDLMVILSTEQGKPLAQAEDEYHYSLDRMTFMAGEALRVHGQTLQSINPNKRTIVIRQPFGVVAGIAPWNFPASTVLNKIVPAMAAGNTVVLKPAQDTPLTALALAYLAGQAGVPAGVLNVVLAEHPDAVGQELTGNPIVRKFSFTGSTAVGKRVYAQCAATVKNIALELGGNSPMIVFPDADIDKAAAEGARIKFTNCGQICVNVNRLFVHEDVYEQFVSKVVTHAKAQVLGSGLEPGTTMGPMINEKGIAKVEQLVADAVAQGAKVETGGQRASLAKLFYEPTVLTNMSTEMRMYREEIFGPVIAIYTFSSDEEVIAMANDTEYGLAAYFFTRDLARAWQVSYALEAGGVGVNVAGGFGGGPFGGYKESGIGREQGRVDALDEWCEVKSISIALN